MSQPRGAGQKVGRWLGNAHRPPPGLGILWGRGQEEALGWERGFAMDPSLPFSALGELSVTEPVLSQHSAITHSRKPRQLRSMLRWAPCQGIDCP